MWRRVAALRCGVVGRGASREPSKTDPSPASPRRIGVQWNVSCVTPMPLRGGNDRVGR